jgi:starvation-inducible DNA-binding protein
MATRTTKRPATKKATANKAPGKRAASKKASARQEVPDLPGKDAAKVVEVLQDRLVCLLDLQLTLKHVHWNVVGPNFIAVHEMLDPQVLKVREMSDEVAERIATCGGEPLGTPGAVVATRRWEDYSLGRASTQEHLEALDAVYAGVISDHRDAVDDLEDLDPVSEDLMIDHLGELELFAWFVRSHLGR